jgi:Icc-related predicted phosphoesterase
MRILVASDLHYSLKQLDWVVGVAGQYDLVVLAGDHLDIRSYVEPDAQIAVVLEYLTRIAAKTTVAACSGNHDLNAENDLDERTAIWLQSARDAGVYVDGTSMVTDDVRVTVCPWWDGPRTRERFADMLAEEAEAFGERVWVWVYHAPPDRSATSWTGRRYYGDTDLNAWIERFHPDLVLCGHVHESPFADEGSWSDRIGATLVVNPGREPGPVPAHAIVDTEARSIRWMSTVAAADVSFATAKYSGSGSRADRSSERVRFDRCMRLPSTVLTMPSPPS